MKRSFRGTGRALWFSSISVVVALAVTAAPAQAEKATGQRPPKDIKVPSDPVFETSCPDLSGCFWPQTSYGGARFTASVNYAGSWYSLMGYDRSSKNRFGNRRIQFGEYLGGGTYQIRDCLNPGVNSANLVAAIDSFKVGAQGTTC